MSSTRYSELEAAAHAEGLIVYGALHPSKVQDVEQLNHGTLILLGCGDAFWPSFCQSPEYNDGVDHPIDRWSRRVIDHLARDLGANQSFYPFDGPPYAPFVNWALASGRAFTSPSQFLVHDQVGLMISYRGALHFDAEFDIPAPGLAHSPCTECTSKACINTCPVQAMVDGGPYQVAACHSHLDTSTGSTTCLSQGCVARRACPLSQGSGRSPAQSAHHMRYFHLR